MITDHSLHRPRSLRVAVAVFRIPRITRRDEEELFKTGQIA